MRTVFATERILRKHDETRASSYHVEANEQKNSRVKRRLDYGVGSGFSAACQMSIAQASCLLLLVALLWFRPHFMNLHTSQQATAITIILGWTLILGGFMN